MCAYAREIRVALAGVERSYVRQPCKAVWQDGGGEATEAPAQPRQGPQDGPLCHKWPLWFELEFTQSAGSWRV